MKGVDFSVKKEVNKVSNEWLHNTIMESVNGTIEKIVTVFQ